MNNIGIIFAMKEELDELLKLANIKEIKKIYDLELYICEINNKKCTLVESGVGKVNSSRTTQVLIDNFNIDIIINIGVAGGIDKNINVLDLVVSNKLVQHDFDISAFNHKKGYIPKIGDYLSVNNDLVKLCKKVDNNVKIGTIASGDAFITDKDVSENINKEFNALCTDMESASIAQVAYLCNKPFIIIRCISDTIYTGNNKITYEEFLSISSKKVSKYLIKLLGELK